MTEGGELRPGDLARQLLDFSQAPGRHALRLGEPRALFSNLETIAQWAMGRLPAELDDRTDELVGSAILFIQRACFAPDNNHYQVLGLTPASCSPELLRTRYRTLIRLTHPDMGITGLPADAAGTVNRAADVLGDDAARQRYDEQLRKHNAPRPPPAAAPGMGSTAGRPPPATPGSRQRVAVVPVARTRSLGERWLGLVAQYPRQWHWALVAGVIAIPVALFLLWTAQDTAKGGALVAGKRTPTGTQSDEARRLALLQAPPAETPVRGADQPPVAVNSPRTPSYAPAAVPGGSPVARADRLPRPGRGDASTPAATTDQLPGQAPAVHVPPVRPASPLVAEPARPIPPDVHAPPLVPEARPLAVAPVQPAPVAPTTYPAPAAPAPPAPPPVAPPPPTWTVDTGEARRYAGDIVATMGSASRARYLQDYLTGMKVRGTLLQPAIDLLGRYPDLSVHRSGWSEERQPGAMTLRSVVVLNPSQAGEESRIYRLSAEFRGTENGTVLVRLDLRPER